MKYQVFVSGAPKTRSGDEYARDGSSHTGPANYGDSFRSGQPNGSGPSGTGRQNRAGDGAPYSGHSGTLILRRFPPVVQFLTDVDPYVQHQLQTVCIKAHRQGLSLHDICQELYVYARSIGYSLMLGVQEVFSTQMPSFPEQTVQSALLMADLKRTTTPNGYHEGRVSV